MARTDGEITGQLCGREAELETLETLLIPLGTLVTLVGEGGIGKTAVAREAAALPSLRETYPDGVFFVRLAASDRLEAVPAAIAEAVGLTLAPEASWERLGEALEAKVLLLLLDSLEQLPLAAALDALMQRCPHLTLLVTSREPLYLLQERRLPLSGLMLPPDAGVDFEAFAATELFLRVAQRSLPGFRLREADKPHLLRICRELQGWPLGIELAAVWLQHLSCEAIAEEVSRNLDFLSSSAPQLDPRHRSARAVLDSTWRSLSLEEARVMRGLSVFRGGFYRKAALEVLACDPVTLNALEAKSLLMSAGDRFYTRQPLVYRYARERLAENTAEHNALQEQHAQYFARALLEHERRSSSSQEVEVYRLVERGLENLQAAWSFALTEGRLELLRQGVYVLRSLFDLRGKPREGLSFFSSAQTLLPHSDSARALLGEIYEAQARFYGQLAEYPRAQKRAQESLELLRPLAERRALSRTLETLGWLALVQGDLRTARAPLEEALSLNRSLGQAQGEVSTLCHLAQLHETQGTLEEARYLYLDALRLARTVGAQTTLALSLTGLGSLYLRLERTAAAKTALREAAALAQSLRSPTLALEALERLADSSAGDPSEARTHLREALRYAQDLKRLEGVFRLHLKAAHTFAASPAEARPLVLKALELALGAERPLLAAQALVSLARITLQTGQAERAAEMLGLAAQYPLPDATLAERAGLLERIAQTLSPEALQGALKQGERGAFLLRARYFLKSKPQGETHA